MAEQKKKNKKRRVRSFQTGKYTSPVTDGKGKAVKTGTGSTVKSRSFKKPKAAPEPAAKAAPPRKVATKSKRRVPVGFNVGQGRPTRVGKNNAGVRPKNVGQGRPTRVGKNNAGVRPKQGPKDRKDIKGGLLNPLRSDEPLLSAARARQGVGAMFRGRKRDGTPRRIPKPTSGSSVRRKTQSSTPRVKTNKSNVSRGSVGRRKSRTSDR